MEEKEEPEEEPQPTIANPEETWNSHAQDAQVPLAVPASPDTRVCADGCSFVDRRVAQARNQVGAGSAEVQLRAMRLALAGSTAGRQNERHG